MTKKVGFTIKEKSSFQNKAEKEGAQLGLCVFQEGTAGGTLYPLTGAFPIESSNKD